MAAGAAGFDEEATGAAVMAARAAGFDEEAWLRRLEDALAHAGRECRTIELAESVAWGEPGTGTEGCDLTALREFLKLHPGRFRLKGNVAALSEGGGDPDDDQPRPSGAAALPKEEDGLLVQRVEAALEGFGGQCSTTDLADRLLWGLPGSGTERTPLRDFLQAHSRHFGLRATTVWSLRVFKREGELPGRRLDFDEGLWLTRARRACRQQTVASGSACLTRDLFVRLDWGAPKSQTYGRVLRDFLRAHHHHFKLEGYRVSLLDAEAGARAAETGSPRRAGRSTADAGGAVHVPDGPDDGREPALSLSAVSFRDTTGWEPVASNIPRPSDAVAFERVERAISELGGVCSLADLADTFLWGEPGSGTEGRTLRTVLRAHSRRVEVDGSLVYLLGSGPAGLERDDEVLALLAEAHVRTFGGTCTLRDLHAKLRWGRSPRTDHGRTLREFLLTRPERFALGGAPTPGSSDGRSRVSVSLRHPEADFDEELWLLKVEATVLRGGGRCTTRDVYLGLGWGRPGTGTRGRALREFLAGRGRRFRLEGFSILLQDLPREPWPGPEERLKRAEAALASWGWGLSATR